MSGIRLNIVRGVQPTPREVRNSHIAEYLRAKLIKKITEEIIIEDLVRGILKQIPDDDGIKEYVSKRLKI